MRTHFIGGPRAGEIHPIKSKTPRIITHHDGTVIEYLLTHWVEVGSRVAAADVPVYYVWDRLHERRVHERRVRSSFIALDRKRCQGQISLITVSLFTLQL